MAYIETWFTCDLLGPVQTQIMKSGLFNQDSLGNLIGVEVYSNGTPVTLSGSVTGYIVLSNGTTVPVAGSKSTNKAWIVMPASAYAVPGEIKIAIKLTDGSSITTLASCKGYMEESRTGTQVDPGQTVTDWTNQISAALQEVANALDEINVGFLDSHGGNFFALNDDLNSFMEAGSWSCTTSAIARSLVNSPFPGNVIRLFVFRYSNANNSFGQLVVDKTSGTFAMRAYNSGWGEWKSYNALLEQIPIGFLTTYGTNIFSSNDDLDTFMTPGSWYCEYSSVAQSLINSPFPGKVIRLFVFRYSNANNSFGQLVVDRSSGTFATRAYDSGWGSWKKYADAEDFENLKKATKLYKLDTIEDAEFILGYYYSMNPVGGSPVSTDPIVAGASTDGCYQFECSEGDVFQVSLIGAGSSTGGKRAYAFLNASRVVIEMAEKNQILDDQILIAPANSAYFIVNSGKPGTNSAIQYRYAVKGNNISRYAVLNENMIKNECFKMESKYDTYFEANDDLNDFTNIGSWMCRYSAEAASLVNNPFPGQIIRLFVYEISNSGGVVAQSVVDRYTGCIATRAYYNGWSKWIYSDNTKLTETALLSSDTQWSFEGRITREGYTYTSGSSFTSSDYISISPGDYIHLAGCCSSTDHYLCFFYNDNYQYIGGCIVDLTSATYADYFVVAPINAAYIRAQVRNTFLSSGRIYKVADRIVETPTSTGIKMIENISAETNNRLLVPFYSLKKSHQPLFTIIDDDTRSYNQVTDFYKVCDDNGVFGTSACITKFPVADSTIKNALLNAELKGHQTVFHCHDQYSNAHWQDETTYRDEILENVATGIHEIANMGFCDWKHWITPAGVSGALIKSLARRYGFSSITSITQNDFVGYDGNYTRWKIPRMELYPDDTGHATGQTLAGIKAKIDECVAMNGWLLVGVHCYQDSDYSSGYSGTKGWNNLDGLPNMHAAEVVTAADQTRFEQRFARMYEMLQYAKNAGMNCVTFGEGLSYWDPVFRIYEPF